MTADHILNGGWPEKKVQFYWRLKGNAERPLARRSAWWGAHDEEVCLRIAL
jgi:hypothetical protein